MRVEETIQTQFDKHPMSCGTREQVLFHIVCGYGTGFEWKNGELVYDEGEDKFTGKLGEDGKAVQRISDEDAVLAFVYDSIRENSGKEDVVSLDGFKERIKEMPSEVRDSLLEHSYSMMKQLRETRMKMPTSFMCRAYSPVLNIPEDITPDWAAAVEEAKAILVRLNVDLESIE